MNVKQVGPRASDDDDDDDDNDDDNDDGANDEGDDDNDGTGTGGCWLMSLCERTCAAYARVCH